MENLGEKIAKTAAEQIAEIENKYKKFPEGEEYLKWLLEKKREEKNKTSLPEEAKTAATKKEEETENVTSQPSEESNLPNNPSGPSGKEYFEQMGNKTFDARDAQIMADLKSGKLKLHPSNYQFTEIEKEGADGTKITFEMMNGPLRIGDDGYAVPASPQLAAFMRDEYGLHMPTPSMVDSAMLKAQDQGQLEKMLSTSKDASKHNIAGLPFILEKGRKFAALVHLDPAKLSLGTGKTKVVSQREQEHGHHEYGGYKTGKLPDNFDKLTPQQKEQYIVQVGAAHGAGGHQYADYSSEFQGIKGKVTIEEPGKAPFQMEYQDALRDPKYGKILNNGRPLDGEKSYQRIARNSKILPSKKQTLTA